MQTLEPTDVIQLIAWLILICLLQHFHSLVSAGLVIRGVPLGDGLQALNMAKDSTSGILQDGAIKDVNTPSDCCDLIKGLRKAGWFDIREMGSRIEGKFEVFNDAF